MNIEDLFYKLTNEGILVRSELDKNFNPIRIYRFKDKKYKLT